jgi:hypothetical protein
LLRKRAVRMLGAVSRLCEITIIVARSC